MTFCRHTARSLTHPSTDSSTTAEHAATGDCRAVEAKADGTIAEAEADDTVWMLYLGEFTPLTSRK